MNKPIIEAQHIAKTYHDGALNVEVLRDLNFSINENESVSIIGASGSGKSTLLHILGGLDKPDSGSLKIIGQDLKTLSQAKLGALRNQKSRLCVPIPPPARRVHRPRKRDDALVDWQTAPPRSRSTRQSHARKSRACPAHPTPPRRTIRRRAPTRRHRPRPCELPQMPARR